MAKRVADGADDAEGRAERRRALARQIEEQVSKLTNVHDDLVRLVNELREDADG